MTGQELTMEAMIGFTLLIIGLLGAGISIILNMLNAPCCRERAFVARASLGIAVAFFLMLCLMYYLPSPWRFMVLLLYLGGMPVMIYRVSFRRQEIHEEESRERRNAGGEMRDAKCGSRDA